MPTDLRDSGMAFSVRGCNFAALSLITRDLVIVAPAGPGHPEHPPAFGPRQLRHGVGVEDDVAVVEGGDRGCACSLNMPLLNTSPLMSPIPYDVKSRPGWSILTSRNAGLFKPPRPPGRCPWPCGRSPIRANALQPEPYRTWRMLAISAAVPRRRPLPLGVVAVTSHHRAG